MRGPKPMASQAFEPIDSWRHDVAQRIIHEPLFDTRNSLAGIRNVPADRRPRTVFVGLGLCTRRELTRAVPLDVLGMLLPAELLRRRLGAPELLVLIADRHALENGFPAEAVETRARILEEALGRIRAGCRLDALRTIRASSFHHSGEYLSMLAGLRRRISGTHDYVLRQFADILYLSQARGPFLKVGWALPSEEPLRRRDELALDHALTHVAGNRFGFVYCKPGRTLADASPRVCPYIVKRPEARLCLDRPEDVSLKLGLAERTASPETVAGFRSHLRRLVYTFCRVVEPLPKDRLDRRVAMLVTRLQTAGTTR